MSIRNFEVNAETKEGNSDSEHEHEEEFSFDEAESRNATN